MNPISKTIDMKLFSYNMFIGLIILFFCCSAMKGGDGDHLRNEAIIIAINDFLDNCSLQKTDSVFSVYIDIDNEDILGLSISGGGASGQTDIIYFFIELRYQSGTIYSVLVVTACAVADTHPLRRGNVQFVIIFHIYVNTHADRSFCQCLVIEPGR